MDSVTALTLDQLQYEVAEWSQRNFGAEDPGGVDRLLGMGEELGELDHAILKQRHAIRGGWDQHEAEAKDAFGDLIIFALDFAARRGWNAAAVVTDTWSRVQRRDWVLCPVDGGQGLEAPPPIAG